MVKRLPISTKDIPIQVIKSGICLKKIILKIVEKIKLVYINEELILEGAYAEALIKNS